MRKLLLGLLLMPALAFADVSKEKLLVELTETLATVAANQKAMNCYMQHKLMLTALATKERGINYDDAIASRGDEDSLVSRGYALESYLDDSLDAYFKECIER